MTDYSSNSSDDGDNIRVHELNLRMLTKHNPTRFAIEDNSSQAHSSQDPTSSENDQTETAEDQVANVRQQDALNIGLAHLVNVHISSDQRMLDQFETTSEPVATSEPETESESESEPEQIQQPTVTMRTKATQTLPDHDTYFKLRQKHAQIELLHDQVQASETAKLGMSRELTEALQKVAALEAIPTPMLQAPRPAIPEEQLVKLLDENLRLQSDNTRITRDYASLEAKHAIVESKFDDMARECKKVRREAQDFERQYKSAHSKVEVRDEIITEMEQSAQVLRDETTTLNTQLYFSGIEIRNLKASKQAIEERFQSMRSSKNDADDAKKDVDTQLKFEKRISADLQEQVTSLTAERDTAIATQASSADRHRHHIAVRTKQRNHAQKQAALCTPLAIRYIQQASLDSARRRLATQLTSDVRRTKAQLQLARPFVSHAMRQTIQIARLTDERDQARAVAKVTVPHLFRHIGQASKLAKERNQHRLTLDERDQARRVARFTTPFLFKTMAQTRKLASEQQRHNATTDSLRHSELQIQTLSKTLHQQEAAVSGAQQQIQTLSEANHQQTIATTETRQRNRTLSETLRQDGETTSSLLVALLQARNLSTNSRGSQAMLQARIARLHQIVRRDRTDNRIFAKQLTTAQEEYGVVNNARKRFQELLSEIFLVNNLENIPEEDVAHIPAHTEEQVEIFKSGWRLASRELADLTQSHDSLLKDQAKTIDKLKEIRQWGHELLAKDRILMDWIKFASKYQRETMKTANSKLKELEGINNTIFTKYRELRALTTSILDFNDSKTEKDKVS